MEKTAKRKRTGGPRRLFPLLGLTEARKEAGLQQKELAARVGISNAALSQLEHLHTKASYKTIKILADELETSPDLLVLGQRWFEVDWDTDDEKEKE